jgi:cyanophycinase
VRSTAWILTLALGVAGPMQAQAVGPARGTLFVAGGGMRDPGLGRTFLELAGGSDARIVVIPTAGENADYTQEWDGLDAFRALGAVNLVVLHTRDRRVADSDAFAGTLRDADAVWLAGGRQWRLADVYLGTATERELRALLARGGTIGGSSAGATIQGSYLVRGDTRGNTVVMGDHEEGFGFLVNTAIDQHLLRRNRQFDLIEVIEAHPELLGIGIDENTAIVVRGDSFDVIGNGYVAIYDPHTTVGNGGRFYFLAPGDRFDLAHRTARRGPGTGRPLDGLTHQEWP